MAHHVVHLDQYDLDDLPEYSASLPTGTYLGKRWKRQTWPFPPDSGRCTFRIGEFYDIGSTSEVGIRWSRVVIVERYTDVPEDPHPRMTGKCLCETPEHKFGACPACVAWRWRNQR